MLKIKIVAIIAFLNTIISVQTLGQSIRSVYKDRDTIGGIMFVDSDPDFEERDTSIVVGGKWYMKTKECLVEIFSKDNFEKNRTLYFGHNLCLGDSPNRYVLSITPKRIERFDGEIVYVFAYYDKTIGGSPDTAPEYWFSPSKGVFKIYNFDYLIEYRIYHK